MAASPPKIAPFLLIDDYDETLRKKLRSLAKEASAEGVTPLYKAIKTQQFDLVPPIIHAHNGNIHYALFLAVEKEDFDVAMVLLQRYQADINWVNNGLTILQHAVDKMSLSAWEFLLKNKAETIIHETQESILHFIIESNDKYVSEAQKIERIKILLTEYPDMVHHRNKEGVTALASKHL